MSDTQRQPRDDQPIVLHGPLTGDGDRLAGLERPLPPATPKPLPPARPMGPRVVAAPEPAPVATPVAAPATLVSAAPSGRVFGLDAFRGLLLLAMNFTFTIPPWGPFAKWMYHTQVPPSLTRQYVEVAGLTWQDMLFPMFVFTMAAAMPIAMSGRLAKGKPYPDIVMVTVKRGFLLLLFALLIGHVNPYWTQDYTKRGNVLSILGLLVSFAVFVQPPPSWKPAAVRALKTFGWIGAAAILFAIPYFLYGQWFSHERRDHIMAALAFCTVAGTVIWLFTRRSVSVRLLVLAVLVLVRTLAPSVGWIGSFWYTTPMPWFYQPWYVDLLIIVIPGTIAGEQILRWMKRPADETEPARWPAWRLWLLAAIAFSFNVILNVGLYERRHPLETTLAVVGVSALLLAVAWRPLAERDRVLASLFKWGTLWLVLGMLAEPLEGGVKKDPQTLGFLLLMTGAAIASLGSLLIVADALRSWMRGLRPVALIGQNALLAYVILMLGIEHVLWLTGLGDRFTSTWQIATARSLTLTFVAGLIVWIATRKRLIMRA